MNLLDRIKSFFKGHGGDAETLIQDADSTEEILEQLDELITRNEVELRKVRQELARLEMNEHNSAESIRQGKVGEREKDFVLHQIKRTRTQMKNLKLRADILNKNVELHMNLVGKIQSLEAMDLRGIENSMVEKIMLDYEEGMDKFREVVHTADGVTDTRDDLLSTKDQNELRDLEREIMGEDKPTTVETPTTDSKESPETATERPPSLTDIERELADREQADKDDDSQSKDREAQVE